MICWAWKILLAGPVTITLLRLSSLLTVTVFGARGGVGAGGWPKRNRSPPKPPPLG